MAASQPSVGGLPTASRRSFADVLAAKPSPSASISSHPYDSDPLKMGLHKGQPAAFFNDNQLQGLSVPYSWSLVGKFSQGYNKTDPKKGRPSLDNLHRYFLTLDFKGAFSLGLLDNRHVIIHMSNEADYLRLYSRMVWYIGSVTMRIFRWSPYFRVDKESPLVPVWITMPRLPIMLFEQNTLLSLASLIGCPLRRDDATIHLKRPSVARIQVEVDLLKPRPDQIWIGLGATDGYWQKIEYESLPDYCQKCWHVGHSEAHCRVDHLQFKSPTTNATVPASPATVPVSAAFQRLNQIYVPKNPQPSAATVPPLAVLTASATVPPPVVPPNTSAPILSKAAALAPDASVPIPSTAAALAPSSVGLPLAQQEIAPLSMAPAVDADTGPITAVVDTVGPSVERPTQVLHDGLISPVLSPGASAVSVPVLTQPSATLVPGNVVSAAVPLAAACVPGADSVIVYTSTTQSPSLSATYKQVLVDSCLSDAQEIGFSPSAIEASAPQNAMVLYHSAGQPNVQHLRTRWHPAFDNDIAFDDSSDYHHDTFGSTAPATGYNAADYYCGSFESDNLEDEESSYDITDGSEGTVRQKRKDRKRSQAYASSQLVSKELFEEQSRSLGKQIKKRGRPPGSRNRTFFDVVRTMGTRASKSTSS